MRRKNGFTIIEVTLVLAIAGLILIMAIIALPALARSQRDAQRKSDIVKIADTIKKYQSNNNRGSLPASENELNTVVDNYGVSLNKNDPDGTGYTYKYKKCGDVNPDKECTDTKLSDYTNHGEVWFIVEAHCGGDDGNEPIKTANPRKAALLYRLENGDEFFCYAI